MSDLADNTGYIRVVMSSDVPFCAVYVAVLSAEKIITVSFSDDSVLHVFSVTGVISAKMVIDVSFCDVSVLHVFNVV